MLQFAFSYHTPSKMSKNFKHRKIIKWRAALTKAIMILSHSIKVQSHHFWRNKKVKNGNIQVFKSRKEWANRKYNYWIILKHWKFKNRLPNLKCQFMSLINKTKAKVKVALNWRMMKVWTFGISRFTKKHPCTKAQSTKTMSQSSLRSIKLAMI